MNLIQFQVRQDERFAIQVSPQGQTEIAQPVEFWKRITTAAMDDFRTLKTKSNSKNELNQALLHVAREALREYKEIVTSKQMSGAYMLEMWRKTMANLATSAGTNPLPARRLLLLKRER